MNSSNINKITVNSLSARFYKRRISAFELWKIKLKKISLVFSNIRLLLFLLIFTEFYCISLWELSIFYYSIPLITGIGFFYSIYFHSLIKEKIEKLELKIFLCKRSLERIRYNWAENPYDPYNYILSQDDELMHAPGSFDLDLFGSFSLFHLIDSTTSLDGENQLKKEILSSLEGNHLHLDFNSFGEDLKKKQTASRELARHRKLSLEYQIAGLTFRQLKSNRKKNEKLDYSFWSKKYSEGNQKLLNFLGWLALISICLSLGTYIIETVFGIFFFFMPAAILQLVLFGLILFKKGIDIEIIEKTNRFLPSMMNQIGLISTVRYKNSILKEMTDELKFMIEPLSELQKINSGLKIRRLGFIWFLLNLLTLWDLHVYKKLVKWLRKNPDTLTDARDILRRIDGLISISIFLYDFNARGINPKLCMPELFPDSTLLIDVKNIKHPLIQPQKAVGNDFFMEKDGSIVLLTGSNMSGKSTFLRNLALNYILASMGCGVFADKFKFCRMNLLCSIRINDSLQESISLFYQEVLKIKEIINATKNRKPCFILIDEMFKGTNTRERRIASESIIKKLSKSKTLTIIATHDLELTRIRIIDTIQNFHFRESIVDKGMHFEYRLHKGALKATNALKILELAGIRIDRD
jgi:ABC-type Na+ transport system ATPase subunit NatA